MRLGTYERPRAVPIDHPRGAYIGFVVDKDDGPPEVVGTMISAPNDFESVARSAVEMNEDPTENPADLLVRENVKRWEERQKKRWG